jgi:hypothetical protein
MTVKKEKNLRSRGNSYSYYDLVPAHIDALAIEAWSPPCPGSGCLRYFGLIGCVDEWDDDELNSDFL